MKFRNILLFSAIAFSSVSCDKFLDVEPVGKVIPETYTDFRAMLTGAYQMVPTDRSLTALRSDEAQLSPSSFSFDTLKDIYIWNDASQDANTKQFPWQAFYKTIFYTNHIIHEGVHATQSTPEMVNQMVGEAYLLRAYMHFNLVNLFADQYGVSEPKTQRGIPISTSIDLEKDYVPNTVAEVYEQVISDINSALELININEQPKGYNYRFSKISAYGFAARVYLNMNDFAKAKEFAQKALEINKNLEDLNNPAVVMPYSYKSVENILALEHSFSIDIARDVYASPAITSLYNATEDLRYDAYFTTNGSNTMVKLGAALENKVSMRTAEFYLVMAEAIAKSNGDLTEAKGYLKELLKNRLTNSYYNEVSDAIDAMGKDEFVTYLFEERGRELAFQGFRWYDLKRNGKKELTKTLFGTDYTLQKGDARYVVRFPKEAIANNPNLAN